MNKIKVLFVLPALSSGGAERIVCNLINSMDKTIFEIKLFLFCDRGQLWNLLSNDIEIYFGDQKYNSKLSDGNFKNMDNLQKDNISMFKVIKNLYKVTKGVDIVVGSSELTPTYFSIIVGKFLRKKVVGWVHIDIESLLKRKSNLACFLHKYFLIKLFYNRLDKIISVSKSVEVGIKRYLNKSKQNDSITIYNPIDINYIRKMAEKYIDIGMDEPIIIGIGRLVEQKNFKMLIQVHKYLLSQGVKQNLVILGEGYKKNELENLIIDNNLEKSVKLLGFKDNPYAYLRRANIFVQTSLYEGLPTVIIESLCLGIPVVAMNCPGGTSEILENGKYGILVKSDKVEEIAKAISFLLNNDKERGRLIKEGLNSIKRFDSKINVKVFEKIFMNFYESKRK